MLQSLAQLSTDLPRSKKSLTTNGTARKRAVATNDVTSHKLTLNDYKSYVEIARLMQPSRVSFNVVLHTCDENLFASLDPDFPSSFNQDYIVALLSLLGVKGRECSKRRKTTRTEQSQHRRCSSLETISTKTTTYRGAIFDLRNVASNAKRQQQNAKWKTSFENDNSMGIYGTKPPVFVRVTLFDGKYSNASLSTKRNEVSTVSVRANVTTNKSRTFVDGFFESNGIKPCAVSLHRILFAPITIDTKVEHLSLAKTNIFEHGQSSIYYKRIYACHAVIWSLVATRKYAIVVAI